MAAARKSRNVSIPITEYTVPLADVLAALLDPSELKQGGWSMLVTGDTVVLTRVGSPVDVADPKGDTRVGAATLDAATLDASEPETP